MESGSDSRADQARLLERSGELAVLDEAVAAVSGGRGGRLVLISGEAGVGKTALLREFCAARRDLRVLWGACDALLTPRPLAPLVEIAEQAGGDLARLVDAGAAPATLVAGLAQAMTGRSTALLVLEDMHWADEATLDVLRVLGRRIGTLPAVVVVSYRDGLDRAHPLRVVLGDLPAGHHVERLPIAPLSLAAVTALAEPLGVDAGELYRRTGGNGFFVTEVLAAHGDELPGSVRDAVLARAARLGPGPRSLLDAVALVTPRADLWLLERVAGEELRFLDECLASAMLHAEGVAVGFRHELARVAIEESVSPWRRLELHRSILAALSAPPGGPPDPARLAYHAEAADDGAAVLRFAPEAAERAAAVGAHRQAAAQLGRALRFAAGLPGPQRAELLERLSYECYLTAQITEAIEARRSALAERRRGRDRRREGDDHRWLSRLSWFAGDNTTAETEAVLAVRLLEELPPGPELAMAYSNLAQLGMLAGDLARAVSWGERAIELAGRLGETDTLVHALNNVGTAELIHGDLAGQAKLEQSLQLALDLGLEEHAARAYTNLASSSVEDCRYAAAADYLSAGIEYSRDHDLDSWLLYMLSWQARADLEQGRWDLAAEAATSVLDQPDLAAPSRIAALAVLGGLRARRGDPDAWPLLDEALELAERTGELQRLAPVALARAEARWLAGQDEAIKAETEAAMTLAVRNADAWRAGELAVWRHRAGIADELAAAQIAEPFGLELQGDGPGAARRWVTLGRPYEAALALAGSDAQSAIQQGMDQLRELGAWAAVSRVARQLRQRGVRGIASGPRSATRRNPAGLTARELEVLELLAEGLRNAEIAGRLFLSEKTVVHHVSSIMRKLSASTRGQAVDQAVRAGFIQR